jgi:hypothetical protein
MDMEGGDVDGVRGSGQTTGGVLPYSYEEYDLGSWSVNSSLRCNTL